MSSIIKNILIEGNHNIVLTEVNGSTITLSLSELFEQYATQLDEILVLLKNKQEASYLLLVKEIQEYKNSHYRSELDGFNLYLEHSKNNQAAASSQPIIGKTVADLDKRHLKTLFALARVKEHFKQYKVNTKASIEEKLRSLRLMTNGYVIKGTFLCLANYTNFGFMGGFVDEASFGAFDTLDKIIIKKSEHPLGNIIEQYHTLFEYITGELSPQIMVDIKNREWDYAIPRVVIQELLANALVHRSYENTVRRPVTVDIYPDRIVIENPGTFPENINPSDLNTIKSEPKNKEIARIFFLHKIIEDRGSGIARVQDLLQKRNMRPAEFKQENGFVTVTVYKLKAIIEIRNSNKENTYFPTFHNTSATPLFNKVIGLDNDLEKVHQILAENKSCVIVNSIGGIGKTTLARYYIQQYAAEYQHIIWLHENKDANEIFFSDILLLDNLGIREQVFDYLNKENKKAAIQLVMQTLNKLSRPVLLIADNVQDLVAFQYLTQTLDKSVYHVLITSRQEKGDFLFYFLDTLSPEEAKDLFCLYYFKNTTVNEEKITAFKANPHLERILIKTNYHTLSLEVLARILRSSNTLTLETLADKLEKEVINANLKDGIDEFYTEEEANIYKTIISAFNIGGINNNNKIE